MEDILKKAKKVDRIEEKIKHIKKAQSQEELAQYLLENFTPTEEINAEGEYYVLFQNLTQEDINRLNEIAGKEFTNIQPGDSVIINADNYGVEIYHTVDEALTAWEYTKQELSEIASKRKTHSRPISVKRAKQYHILNRVTKEEVDIEAPSAQEACEKMGWMVGDCYVREIKEKRENKPVLAQDETLSKLYEDAEGGIVNVDGFDFVFHFNDVGLTREATLVPTEETKQTDYYLKQKEQLGDNWYISIDDAEKMIEYALQAAESNGHSRSEYEASRKSAANSAHKRAGFIRGMVYFVKAPLSEIEEVIEETGVHLLEDIKEWEDGYYFVNPEEWREFKAALRERGMTFLEYDLTDISANRKGRTKEALIKQSQEPLDDDEALAFAKAAQSGLADDYVGTIDLSGGPKPWAAVFYNLSKEKAQRIFDGTGRNPKDYVKDSFIVLHWPDDEPPTPNCLGGDPGLIQIEWNEIKKEMQWALEGELDIWSAKSRKKAYGKSFVKKAYGEPLDEDEALALAKAAQSGMADDYVGTIEFPGGDLPWAAVFYDLTDDEAQQIFGGTGRDPKSYVGDSFIVYQWPKGPLWPEDRPPYPHSLGYGDRESAQFDWGRFKEEMQWDIDRKASAKADALVEKALRAGVIKFSEKKAKKEEYASLGLKAMEEIEKVLDKVPRKKASLLSIPKPEPEFENEYSKLFVKEKKK